MSKKTNNQPKPKIVIVGGGFAGLSVLIRLIARKAPATITLIDQRSSFEYTPALHELLNPKLDPKSAQLSYSDYFAPYYLQAEVADIDPKSKTVATLDQTLSYDFLVLTTGSTTNFYHNSDFSKYCYPCKSIADVHQLRTQLSSAKSATVIGGGYTGVELVSVLAESYPQLTTRLIHSHSTILNTLPKSAQQRAQQFLEQQDVELILKDRLVACDSSNTITLKSGKKLSSDVTILAAGIKPNTEPLDDDNQLSSQLNLVKFPNIFLAGDAAKSGKPTTAHQAMIEGRFIAGQLLTQLTKHTASAQLPNSLIELQAVALGRWHGIFRIGPVALFTPWLVGPAKRLLQRIIMLSFKHHWQLPLPA